MKYWLPQSEPLARQLALSVVWIGSDHSELVYLINGIDLFDHIDKL